MNNCLAPPPFTYAHFHTIHLNEKIHNCNFKKSTVKKLVMNIHCILDRDGNLCVYYSCINIKALTTSLVKYLLCYASLSPNNNTFCEIPHSLSPNNNTSCQISTNKHTSTFITTISLHTKPTTSLLAKNLSPFMKIHTNIINNYNLLSQYHLLPLYILIHSLHKTIVPHHLTYQKYCLCCYLFKSNIRLPTSIPIKQSPINFSWFLLFIIFSSFTYYCLPHHHCWTNNSLIKIPATTFPSLSHLQITPLLYPAKIISTTLLLTKHKHSPLLSF